MLNPILQQTRLIPGMPQGPVPLVLSAGGPQTAGTISLGGQVPFASGLGGSSIGGVIGTLEQMLGSITQMLQGLKGLQGGASGFAGTGAAVSPFGVPTGLVAPGLVPAGFPQAGFAPAGFAPGGLAGSIGGGSGIGAAAGLGPYIGLPGTINGMPFAGAIGAQQAFPGMFGVSGGIPGGIGVAGQVQGFPQQSGIALAGQPQLAGQSQLVARPQGAAPAVVGGSAGLPKFGQDDFVDFLLAGSKGGTAGTDELIDSRFARPNSRFATAGNNEFQAFTAYAYANQFKAFALGAEAAFAPGKDINQLANNVAQAQGAQLTPEAETLSNVAALYRGNLPGINLGTNKPSTYNNPVLQQLLVRWGRGDLANKPGVGQTDVESIGSVVKALNEQPDSNVRKAWLQEIFDFQNNSPSSPSGAVPNIREYQIAIDMYRNGGFAQLLNNYSQGVRTQGPFPSNVGASQGAVAGQGLVGIPQQGLVQGGAIPAAGIPQQQTGLAAGLAPGVLGPQVGVGGADALPGGAPRQPAGITPNHDFRQLNNDQRTQLSQLTDRERAIVHLWGRQMIAKGGQDGGILLTVMEDAQKAQTGGDGSVSTKPAEVQLAQELIQKDQAQFGGVTGKNLDAEFFNIMATKFNDPGLAQRYANSPVFFAANDPNGAAARLPEEFPVDSPQWEAAMSRRSGLDSFNNAVLRLWGHDTLDGGGVDGSILGFTLMSNTSLDKGLNKSFADALLKSDAADGSVDGSSLRSSFKDTLDKLYLNAPGASVQKTFNDAQTRGQAFGLSLDQMGANMTRGAQQALGIAADIVKNHPVMTGVAVGGLMGATAVCPFLGGLGAGAAGIAMGQKMLNGSTAAPTV